MIDYLAERNYHIFYQLCSNAFPAYQSKYELIVICNINKYFLFFSEECLIETDPSKYYYIAQGMLTIDNVDDAEEMRLTDESFNILGFTEVRIHEKIVFILFS